MFLYVITWVLLCPNLHNGVKRHELIQWVILQSIKLNISITENERKYLVSHLMLDSMQHYITCG